MFFIWPSAPRTKFAREEQISKVSLDPVVNSMNLEQGRPSAPSFPHDTAWGFDAFCKYVGKHPDYELKKVDLILFVVSSIAGELTSLPLGIYEAEQGVSLERLGVFNVDSSQALTYPLKFYFLHHPSSISPNPQAGVFLDDS